MLQSLNSGVSGLRQFQEQMDVIGNNIANVNTTGYKSAHVEFADTFSQSLGSSSTTTSSGSMQVGTGVATESIHSSFSQGTIKDTGEATNLAISGNGFFLVTDSTTGATYATRAGDFKLSSDGYLITSDGYRVQGYSDSNLSTRGDLKIDATSNGTTPLGYDDANNTVASTLKGYSIDENGKIWVTLSNNTKQVRGQVLLQNYTDPQSLVKEGNNLYSGLNAAGPLAASSAPNTSGLGSIESSKLETSNVDITTEFTNLITSQRAFQASSKIITTADEVLQEIVNLKR